MFATPPPHHFTSDGAPSDHCFLACADHGVEVWQNQSSGAKMRNGRPALNNCDTSRACRKALQDYVHHECLRLVQALGDRFGRDRLFMSTVAFGPPNEDYRVLTEMAGKLPQSSFQKLGLTAGGLRTAFSTLSATLTTLRTDVSTGSQTERLIKKAPVDAQVHDLTWHVYPYDQIREPGLDLYWLLRKLRYNMSAKKWEQVELGPGADGFAIAQESFGSGAERNVFKCSEVNDHNIVGEKLVAKESKYEGLNEKN